MKSLTPNNATLSPKGPRRRIYRIPEAMLCGMLRGELSLPVPDNFTIVGFWRDCSVDRNYFHVGDVVLCVSLDHPSFDEVVWKVPIIDVIEKKPALAQVSVVRKAKVG